MLMLVKKLSWGKCTAKTSVNMIGQQVKSHLLQLSHDMVFLQFCPVYACRVRGKGGAWEIFQTASKGMPRDEFRG